MRLFPQSAARVPRDTSTGSGNRSSADGAVTTYNDPRALALVLAGLFRQSIRDFEITVADDSSGPETARLIAGCAARS
jgi:hypothetical protein